MRSTANVPHRYIIYSNKYLYFKPNYGQNAVFLIQKSLISQRKNVKVLKYTYLLIIIHSFFFCIPF